MLKMSRIGASRFCGLAIGAIAFSLASLIGLGLRGAAASEARAEWLRHQAKTILLSQNDSSLITVPGTSVALSPPANFVLSEQFSGFVNETTFSSITLTELPPEAYVEVFQALSSTPEAISELFASRGIVLDVESVSNIVVQGVQVPFVKGTQTVADTQVQKYFVLVGEESTTLITFNIFDESSISEEAVIETIQSIEVGPAPSIQQKVADLPFAFDTAEPFEVFDVLFGSSVVLSPGGEADPAGEVPLIVIASSVNPVQVADLAEYSTYLLNNTAGLTEMVVTDQSPIEFAGGDGYFTKGEQQGTVALQYVSLRPNDFYIRMIVVGDAAEIEQLMPTIEAIQSSVAMD